MKNYKQWEDLPEKPVATPKFTGHTTVLNSAAQAKTPSLSTILPRRESQPKKASTDENMISPRRSTRKPTPIKAYRNNGGPADAIEASRNKDEPGDEDVILSLSDEKYKTIMWQQYNILGKKAPRGSGLGRDDEVANQIFVLFKRSLGKRGKFFKKMSRSDNLFVVDDEGALRSECLFSTSCANLKIKVIKIIAYVALAHRNHPGYYAAK